MLFEKPTFRVEKLFNTLLKLPRKGFENYGRQNIVVFYNCVFKFRKCTDFSGFKR